MNSFRTLIRLSVISGFYLPDDQVEIFEKYQKMLRFISDFKSLLCGKCV